jgi:hypothetical protein
MIEIRNIILNSNYSSIIFKYFKIGSGRVGFWVVSGFESFGFESGRVLGFLISGRLGFWVVSGSDWVGFLIIWFWVISNFGLFGFKSGQVSGTMISGCLRFQVVSGWVGSGSDQFDFLKKLDRIEFKSGQIRRIFRIGSDFSTSKLYIVTGDSL